MAAGCLGDDVEDHRARKAQPRQTVAEVTKTSRGWGGGAAELATGLSVRPSWMLHKVELMAVQRWPSVVNSGPDKK